MWTWEVGNQSHQRWLLVSTGKDHQAIVVWATLYLCWQLFAAKTGFLVAWAKRKERNWTYADPHTMYGLVAGNGLINASAESTNLVWRPVSPIKPLRFRGLNGSLTRYIVTTIVLRDWDSMWKVRIFELPEKLCNHNHQNLWFSSQHTRSMLIDKPDSKPAQNHPCVWPPVVQCHLTWPERSHGEKP